MTLCSNCGNPVFPMEIKVQFGRLVKGNIDVQVSPQLLTLYQLFAKSSGKTVTHEAIAQTLWPEDNPKGELASPETRNQVSARISLLGRKVRALGLIVISVGKSGFQLQADAKRPAKAKRAA